MTYDPHNPKRSKPNRNVDSGGDGAVGAALAGVFLLVCGLIVGIVLYAVNRDKQTASTTSSPPATTGQAQQAPAPPSSDANAKK